MKSFNQNMRVIVIGASGGIGGAIIDRFAALQQVEYIYALSRNGQTHPSAKVTAMRFDLTSELDIKSTAETLREEGPFDIILIATGLLQGDGISPEKNMRALSFEGLEKSFAINTFGPAITAKYFLPLLRRDQKAVFAALSARVGSISDNRLGGWYAYRSSKAALNMMLKTLSIEFGRRYKDAIIIGLHPGTVDTDLSKPFQGNVPEEKLFTPDYSAEKLLAVIDHVTPQDSGALIAWDGSKIEP